MVGVPGRSKGCNTCIQRKVKCDGGQPVCGNCRKSNRLCTGYKRPVAFVMSSNVTLASESIEDAEGGTITTQGRWRKRTRKTPKALAQDPKPKATQDKPVSASASATASASSSSTPSAAPHAESSPHTQPAPHALRAPRAIDAIDMWTTISRADVKRYGKQYIYHDTDEDDEIEDGDNTYAARQKQLVSTRKAPMTVETLSQVISVIESNANVAMLDFATPVTLSRTAAAARSSNFDGSMLPGMLDAWAVGSPMTQHMASEAAWREQLFPMFLSFHLPNEIISGCKTTTKTLRSRNWLLNLSDTSLDGAPALESAMTALCMARVGRRTKNPALVQHSLRLYTKGLRELQQAIHNPATQLTDQTLAACMAFSMYEIAECPSRHLNGYYSHHTGGLALLKMRGPDAHITPLGHSLFVFMRVQQFIYALLMRKASFLCEPDWTDRPWQTSVKDPQDKFMDQMYCIPVLLEQTDKLEASGATVGPDALVRGYWRIIGQYTAIYRCLQEWHKDLQGIVAGPLYWPELSKLECPIFDGTSQGRPFAVAFHFPAFAIGQSIIIFWIISMMVNHQIHVLYMRIINLQISGLPRTSGVSVRPWSEPKTSMSSAAPSPASASGASSTSSTDSPASSDTMFYASDIDLPSIPAMRAAAAEALATTRTVTNNIAQSVEFFLQEHMGDVGPLSMLLPLTAMRHVLVNMEPGRPCPPGRPECPGENSDEVMWTDFLIRHIGGRGQRLAFYMEPE